MSKKRTAADSNNDEEKNEDSDLLFPQSNNAKRAKLAFLSETTLQDLPMEVIERILFKVVVMEVEEMKLVKRVWIEKADLVISRLRMVCSNWSNILTTNFFINEVHETLHRAAQGTIRVEILHQFPIPFDVCRFTALKDEMFIIKGGNSVFVYNRNDMKAPKDVIMLPGTPATDIAACNVSNCLYVLVTIMEFYSVLRITKNEEHQSKISKWIEDPDMRILSSMSISANGSLVILLWPQGANPACVSIYDAIGCLRRKVMLSPGILCFTSWGNAIQKSNGNLVLVSVNDHNDRELTEIDATGSVVRKRKSSLRVRSDVNFADCFGRLVITEEDNRIRLFDSEFNLLDFTGPPLSGSIMHYDYERNEVVSILSGGRNISVLTIFRFAEE